MIRVKHTFKVFDAVYTDDDAAVLLLNSREC